MSEAGEADERGGIEGRRFGRFTVTRSLGDLGAGEVWAARDAALDREVAIKLVRSGDGGLDAAGRLGLVAQAQAMARLAHPNVVRIFELGSEGDVVFCAMERVEGATLTGWLAAAPRPWRAIVDVLIGAGRGLAAGHDAGVVHGDPTAAHVVISDDGRVRVGDFGLAAPAGTPGHLAPERRAGGAADARTDQFAFCVAALAALDAAGGRRAAPAALHRAAPAALRRALRRGLDDDPARRWPSMAALLAAIERAAAAPRRRRRLAIAAAALLALAGAGWLIVARDPEDQVRSAGESRMARAWNPARRAELAAALTRTGHPGAGEVAVVIGSTLDAYRRGWLEARVDAWRASYAQESISGPVLEQTLACLDRLSDEMAAYVQMVTSAPGADLPKLTRGAQSLTPVAACADAERRAGILPGWDERERPRPTVVAVEAEQARLKGMLLAGRPADAVTGAVRAIADARTLGTASLAVELELILARAQDQAGDYPGSEATLRAVIQHAAQIGKHRVVADAWIALVDLLGARLQRIDEAAALEPAAQAAVALAGDDPYQRADLAAALGSLAFTRGDATAALAHMKAAYEGFLAARGPSFPMTAQAEQVYGIMVAELGSPDEGYRHVEHAYQLLREVSGEHDPLVGRAAAALAGMARRREDHATSIEYGRKAVDVLSRTFGPDHDHTALARCTVGLSLSALGRHREGAEELRRAIASLTRNHGPDYPDLQTTVLELASVVLEAGDPAEAERLGRDAVTRLEKRLSPGHPDLGYALIQLGHLVAARRPDRSIPVYQRGLLIIDAIADRNPADDVTILDWVAEAGIAAKDPRWALGWLARWPAAAAQMPAARARLEVARRGGARR